MNQAIPFFFFLGRGSSSFTSCGEGRQRCINWWLCSIEVRGNWFLVWAGQNDTHLKMTSCNSRETESDWLLEPRTLRNVVLLKVSAVREIPVFTVFWARGNDSTRQLISQASRILTPLRKIEEIHVCFSLPLQVGLNCSAVLSLVLLFLLSTSSVKSSVKRDTTIFFFHHYDFEINKSKLTQLCWIKNTVGSIFLGANHAPPHPRGSHCL